MMEGFDASEVAEWQAQFGAPTVQKDEEDPAPTKEDEKKRLLEDRVAALVRQGLSDDEVKRTLRDRYGYRVDERRGFTEAELAHKRWREQQQRRSRSNSSSSSSSSRSRSPPKDPRRMDHCDRRQSQRRQDKEWAWSHDKYDDREPSPEKVIEDYRPPEPEWFSRAGGVYIKNPRAWLNEPRCRQED